VKRILEKGDAATAPPAIFERSFAGGTLRAQFGKTWQSLKEVTFSLPNHDRPDLSSRTRCSFKVILPPQS